VRILGIDPGLEITGYGCVGREKTDVGLIEAGVIRTKKSDPLPRRLSVLYESLVELLGEVRPEVIAIEELYSHYKFPRTSSIMGHARGVVLLAAGLQDITVISYGANRIKKSLTGNGHASKEQMQLMVKNVLNLEKVPKPPDVSDAIAVALCHANVLEHM
jgi:crossover junction endodeoxyribonuclease RuvC